MLLISIIADVPDSIIIKRCRYILVRTNSVNLRRTCIICNQEMDYTWGCR